MQLITWYTAVGLLAQLLFTSRMLVQWLMSEKARKVVNPALFWWLSLAGALTMSIYGYLREDLAILLGQFLSFYAYLCNLKLKGELRRIGIAFTIAIAVLPVILMIPEIQNPAHFIRDFLDHETIPYPLLAFGMFGQLCFTFRFILQTFISIRRHESVLPKSFWLVSMTGCIVVLIYGILRLDVVLILGQSMGLITYMRNLKLDKNSMEKRQL